MSSFFTVPASQRKRKRQDAASSDPVAKKRNFNTGSGTRAKQDNARPKKQAKVARDDESISGSDDDEQENQNGRDGPLSDSGSESDFAGETVAEARLRLAERRLETIRDEEALAQQEIGFDAAEIDRERIAARLKEDVAEDQGRVYRFIAEDLDLEKGSSAFFGAKTKATTGVAVCEPYAYTVSKDMCLVKWEIATPPHLSKSIPEQKNGLNTKPVRRKPKQLIFTRGKRGHSNDASYQHHSDAILCVAASSDGKLVVTGGKDKRMIVWDASTLKPLKIFTQHRDSVHAVAFRGKTNQLFSASKDRTIKVWSLDELAYIETLFGHQDEVIDVAAVGGTQERCVSVGARDRTARLWKVVEESQLVFRVGGTGKSKTVDKRVKTFKNGDLDPLADGGIEKSLPDFQQGSVDRVIQLDTQLFVTGADNGSLSLFALHSKKALHTYALAHGVDPPLSREESSAEVDTSKVPETEPIPRWITALACVPYSNFFVSGSWDGYVRGWRVNTDAKRIESIGVLGHVEAAIQDEPVHAGTKGIITDLAVFERGDRGIDGVCVIAGVGTEARLGRWHQHVGRNGAVVFEVPKKVVVNGKTSEDQVV